ncbi:MAG: transglutaminase family protein [Tunicatimonas sp.]
MTNYHIRYEAENTYRQPVNEALFAFLVLPAPSDTQLISEVQTDNSIRRPVFSAYNSFGFEVLYLRIAQPFTRLRFTMDCAVRRSTQRVLPNLSRSKSADEERRQLNDAQFLVDHYWYVQPTSLTALPEATIPEPWVYRYDRPLLEYAQFLTQEVYSRMTYQAAVTTTYTRADELLANPQGVCQDYSHLMLGVLRHHRVPCRYVSGYLNQGEQLVGATQLHAWVEVLIPGLGWTGFDPTNNLLADQHHIKIAHGRDYTDCPPLRGHINPGGLNTTEHVVKVVEQ